MGRITEALRRLAAARLDQQADSPRQARPSGNGPVAAETDESTVQSVFRPVSFHGPEGRFAERSSGATEGQPPAKPDESADVGGSRPAESQGADSTADDDPVAPEQTVEQSAIAALDFSIQATDSLLDELEPVTDDNDVMGVWWLGTRGDEPTTSHEPSAANLLEPGGGVADGNELDGSETVDDGHDDGLADDGLADESARDHDQPPGDQLCDEPICDESPPANAAAHQSHAVEAGDGPAESLAEGPQVRPSEPPSAAQDEYYRPVIEPWAELDWRDGADAVGGADLLWGEPGTFQQDQPGTFQQDEPDDRRPHDLAEGNAFFELVDSETVAPPDPAATPHHADATVDSIEIDFGPTPETIVGDEPESRVEIHWDDGGPVNGTHSTQGGTDDTDFDLPTAAPTLFERELCDQLDQEDERAHAQGLVAAVRQQLRHLTPGVVVLASPEWTRAVATALCRMGITLAREDFAQVLLVDADTETRVLTECFDAQHDGLLEACLDGEPWRDWRVPTATRGLHLLPCGDTVTAAGLTLDDDDRQRLQQLVEQWSQQYDYVLVDAGSATSALAHELIRLSDVTFLLVQLGVTDELSALHALQRLKQFDAPALKCLVTDAVRSGN